MNISDIIKNDVEENPIARKIGISINSTKPTRVDYLTYYRESEYMNLVKERTSDEDEVVYLAYDHRLHPSKIPVLVEQYNAWLSGLMFGLKLVNTEFSDQIDSLRAELLKGKRV